MKYSARDFTTGGLTRENFPRVNFARRDFLRENFPRGNSPSSKIVKNETNYLHSIGDYTVIIE